MAATLKHLGSEVHEVAQRGFGKGTNEHYDFARPNFPVTAIEKIWEQLPKKDGPLNIVDRMGCGTGLFTRSLLAHPEFSKHTGALLATDPSEGMRSVFTQRLAHDPRVRCEEGTFDRLPVEDGWADLVVAAQAWHWCPDHDKALTEIHRILRPTGLLALIWNLEDRDTAWVGQLRDAYEPFELGTPQFRLGLWRTTFQCEAYKKWFESEKEGDVDHLVPTTREGVVNRVFSKSYMTGVQGHEREEVTKKLEEIVDRGEGKQWVDKEKGVFNWPYRTYVITCKLKGQ
ncbi:S-adenosyl-L-methionine-dependent methyltransferase [Dacryopinax primogenitus]|uniref:S-adenosyl-L-methionine-dependent methyltransferase n=1 Tax=Dacryopinax primogenitus (strain DJM 731) TaxID=1858805 RepID=M5G9M1_DACPD|nr:S-adenosyl-L-methionine-dependent methyltransferase [Dacryopinax primogenitus]EJU05499.1 S-adenosyl-L-methionine-dependent methyltransferase [Dacryopinax primogenitus]